MLSLKTNWDCYELNSSKVQKHLNNYLSFNGRINQYLCSNRTQNVQTPGLIPRLFSSEQRSLWKNFSIRVDSFTLIGSNIIHCWFSEQNVSIQGTFAEDILTVLNLELSAILSPKVLNFLIIYGFSITFQCKGFAKWESLNIAWYSDKFGWFFWFLCCGSCGGGCTGCGGSCCRSGRDNCLSRIFRKNEIDIQILGQVIFFVTHILANSRVVCFLPTSMWAE